MVGSLLRDLRRPLLRLQVNRHHQPAEQHEHVRIHDRFSQQAQNEVIRLLAVFQHNLVQACCAYARHDPEIVLNGAGGDRLELSASQRHGLIATGCHAVTRSIVP